MSLVQKEKLALWEQYFSKPSPVLRDALISHYTNHAKMLAAKMYGNRQILEIEFEEFEQYSMLGLIEAVDRFDPAYGVNFKAFASHRIKGAILNGIEKYCEKQQQITMRAKLRTERMQALLKEAASSQKNVFENLVEVAVGTAIGFMLEGTNLYQAGEIASTHHAYHRTEVEDLCNVMSRLVDTLPDQEAVVIKLHYFQQLKFEQIAQELKLTKGRISQIHHSALRRMYEHYDELKLLTTDY